MGLVLASALVPLGVACLEIERQRIALFLDAAADRAVLLIQYDGIHDSGSSMYGDGTDQARQAVAEGDVLFLDWPFHYSPSSIREWLAEHGADETSDADLARFALAHVRTTALGHTSDFQGHVGAAQLVEIERVSELIRLANRAIDAALLGAGEDYLVSMPHTRALILEEARAGGRWLALEGSRLVGSFPVHSPEWARRKADGIAQLLSDESALRELSGWAGVPLAYADAGGRVTLGLGDADGTLELRLRTEHGYEPSLERVLQEVPGTAFDARPATHADVERLILPEDRVRPWIRAARGDAGSEREAAHSALEGFAHTWNAGGALPLAPARGDFALADEAAWLDAWIAWHDELREFPRVP